MIDLNRQRVSYYGEQGYGEMAIFILYFLG
jgi:hypothetical protein